MKVKDLIAKLQECDPDTLVLVDVACEQDWYPASNADYFEAQELRWAFGDKYPEHYIKKGQIGIYKKWHRTDIKAVYIYAR